MGPIGVPKQLLLKEERYEGGSSLGDTSHSWRAGLRCGILSYVYKFVERMATVRKRGESLEEGGEQKEYMLAPRIAARRSATYVCGDDK